MKISYIDNRKNYLVLDDLINDNSHVWGLDWTLRKWYYIGSAP